MASNGSFASADLEVFEYTVNRMYFPGTLYHSFLRVTPELGTPCPRIRPQPVHCDSSVANMEIFPQYNPYITLTFPQYNPYITITFPKYNPYKALIFPQYNPCVTPIFPQYSPYITRIFPQHNPCINLIFPQYNPHITHYSSFHVHCDSPGANMEIFP